MSELLSAENYNTSAAGGQVKILKTKKFEKVIDMSPILCYYNMAT